jgi:putative redox protein
MMCKFMKKRMTSSVTYSGELRTLATHLQSGSTFETDAPTDNQGKGARFSPTDLIGTSLAACMLTTMAIKAKDLESRLNGVTVETQKIMTSAPRKIGAIQIIFKWPEGTSFSDLEKTKLEEIAWSCPVKESIHPDIKLEVNFNW